MTQDNTPASNSANLIYAPNFTQIPNIIFDYWMNVLSPAEFKVLICICRKTFGWQKQRDAISLKQIEKMTGLSRPGISKSLQILLEHRLINKIKSKTADGDDAANQYEINVIHVDVNSVEGGSKLSLPGVVNSVTYGVVNSVNTQKKDYTKENITKERKESATADPSPPPDSSSSKKSSKEEEPKKAYRENVHLTEDQHSKLVKEVGGEAVEGMLDILAASKGSRGVKYKSDYHTMIKGGWVRDKYFESKSKVPAQSAKSKETNNQEITTDEIALRRQFAKQEIKMNWRKFRDGFRPEEHSSLTHLRLFGNEKLYYKDPKFYELFKSYLLKALP